MSPPPLWGRIKVGGELLQGQTQENGGLEFRQRLETDHVDKKREIGEQTHGGGGQAPALQGEIEIDRDLEKLILAKTEGIPFFIEEFVKSLKELKIIGKEDHRYLLVKDLRAVTIPSTIQDMIMARIDTLPEATKAVLQTGSVIEREFSHELIRRVAGLPEEQLLTHLSALKDSELIYERGVYPRSAYIFKHALTREVVYDSILTAKKKKLHEEIGSAIVGLYSHDLTEYCEMLTEHFMASENHEKGAEYAKLAGRKAEKRASFPDAIAYAQKRIFCLEKLPVTIDRQKNIIDERVILGLYLLQINHFAEVKEFINPILDLAISLDYKKRLGQIYAILGSYYFWVEENMAEAFKTFEKGLMIAKEVKDTVTEVFLSYYYGIALSMQCEFEKADGYLGKAVDINKARKNLWGTASIQSSSAYICYHASGKIELAFQKTSEALQMATEGGDIWSKSQAFTWHGASCYGKGLLEEAEKHLLMGSSFCEKYNVLVGHAQAQFYLGEIHFERGNYQKASEYYLKGYSVLEQNRLVPSLVGLIKTAMIRSKVMNREFGQEFGVDLEALYSQVRNNRFKIHEGWIQRYIGEILLNIDRQQISEAEHWIQMSIEADRRNGMRFDLAKGYALYAEFFKRQGDRTKAQENLGKAIEIYKECGADGWQQKAERDLAQLT